MPQHIIAAVLGYTKIGLRLRGPHWCTLITRPTRPVAPLQVRAGVAGETAYISHWKYMDVYSVPVRFCVLKKLRQDHIWVQISYVRGHPGREVVTWSTEHIQW